MKIHARYEDLTATQPVAYERRYQFTYFTRKGVIIARSDLMSITVIYVGLAREDIKLHRESKKDWKAPAALKKDQTRSSFR